MTSPESQADTVADGRRPDPPLLGSLVYQLLNLPAGIASFVVLSTLISVGIGTAIIWVGVPILALAVLLWRGAAALERRRVHTMLGSYIATPYRPAPGGTLGTRWRARLGDGATWKDLTYFLLLLPVGIAEFTIMVTAWATSLGLLFLPVYFRWLPDGSYRLWDWDRPWLIVDSTVDALPFAAVGVLLLAVTVALTRGLGAVHARYARALLGPGPRRLDALAGEVSTGPTSASVGQQAVMSGWAV